MKGCSQLVKFQMPLSTPFTQSFIFNF